MNPFLKRAALQRRSGEFLGSNLYGPGGQGFWGAGGKILSRGEDEKKPSSGGAEGEDEDRLQMVGDCPLRRQRELL